MQNLIPYTEEPGRSCNSAIHECLHTHYERIRRSFWRSLSFFSPNLLANSWRVKFCPTCGSDVKNYEPISNFLRDKLAEHRCPYTLDDFETLNHKAYSCPNCGASDRDRFISSYLQKEFTAGRKFKHILDIAPAKALESQLRKMSKGYRSADLYMEDVTDKVDITNMSVYSDNHFDLAVCSHVLEHIPDDIAAMKEVHRVLKKKGLALFLVPIVKGLPSITEETTINDPAEQWRRFAQNDHVRLYNQQGFIDRLVESGFSVSMVSGRSLLLKLWYDPGYEQSSILYVCTKIKNTPPRQ